MRNAILLGGTVFLFFLSAAFYQYPNSDLVIVVCDVGQGDSILIYQAFYQVLVDGGPDNQVLSCLGEYMPFWDRKIEAIIMTHPQEDHYFGLIDVLKRYDNDIFISNSLQPSTDNFISLKKILAKNQVRIFSPQQGDMLKIGNIHLKFLWPESRQGEKSCWSMNNQVITDQIATNVIPACSSSGVNNLNDISIVALLTYLETSLLLTGDIGFPQEEALVKGNLLSDIDILKVAHHGSKHSTGTGFLRATDPELYLISSGVKNRHGHPAEELISRLNMHGGTIKRTDESSTIVVRSNGTRYWVEN